MRSSSKPAKQAEKTKHRSSQSSSSSRRLTHGAKPSHGVFTSTWHDDQVTVDLHLVEGDMGMVVQDSMEDHMARPFDGKRV
ncbi:hypothetical protein Plhal304r1_c005g0022091 [Plasmopara halstedii]